jgi:hypothetical protein
MATAIEMFDLEGEAPAGGHHHQYCVYYGRNLVATLSITIGGRVFFTRPLYISVALLHTKQTWGGLTPPAAAQARWSTSSSFGSC